MKRFEHPGLINSSLLVFTSLWLVLLAYGMANQFAMWNRGAAAICIFIFGLVYGGLLFWLRQFDHVEWLMILFTLALLVIVPAYGLVLNAAIGPLHGGEIPIIAGVGVLYRYVAMVDATPSVFIQYGAFAMAVAILLGAVSEGVYLLVSRLVPRSFKRRLQSIDKVIDLKSVDISDRLGFMSNQGAPIALGVLFFLLLAIYIIIRSVN